MQRPRMDYGAAHEALLQTALDLTASLSSRERYDRLIGALSRVVGNDACALLRLEKGWLVPVAVHGLSPEVMGQRFNPAEHPRLAAILDSRSPVRFAADDPRPDPYDALVVRDEQRRLDVHSCLGCSLYVGETLIGALTLDALEPGAFEAIDDRIFRTFAALAAAAMRGATLIDSLRAAAEHRGQVAHELVTEARERGGQIEGSSAAMQELLREIGIVAASDLTVLITGETGTGKEVVARTIHARSRRAEQPLVYVNCAALPETLAESELFGHVRGAFTGATADRAGKFELADGGTLLLDEIGELSLAVQPKLLRALQFGEVQRVGADRQHTADVRVIAATNRVLADEVKAGRFRADLYQRLSVYPLHVAALRERSEDIAQLAGRFLDQSRQRLGLTRVRLGPGALRALSAYDWPGNVRELEHVVTRATLRAAAAQGANVVLQAEDLDLGRGTGAASPLPAVLAEVEGLPLARAVEGFQRFLISDALQLCGGNWSAAARRLQIDRANLHRLAKRLKIKI